jgi:hypothetical protein
LCHDLSRNTSKRAVLSGRAWLIGTHGETVVHGSRNLDQVGVVWKRADAALLQLFLLDVPVLVHMLVLV